MKQEVGHTYKLIASDAVFNKLAIISNILLLGTLLPLWILRPEETEFIDLENFEISKVTFRGTMGFLALMLASCYHSQCIHCFVSFMFDAAGMFDDTTERTYIEMAMYYGFLTLAFFLMNLFGFVWGFLSLLVSPPVLFLVLQFVKLRNAKESQEYIAWRRKIQPHRLILGFCIFLLGLICSVVIVIFIVITATRVILRLLDAWGSNLVF